jgi:hypothetical protein
MIAEAFSRVRFCCAVLALLATCQGWAQTVPSVTYRLAENTNLYRIAATAGASPENISGALEATWPGNDEWVNIAPDGSWLLLSTDRLDPTNCTGWECLALVSGDLTTAQAVMVNGEAVHGGFSAIASGGNLIVYEDSSHLWAISRSGGVWSTPLQLTIASPYEFNSQPAIAADGGSVVFDCGPVPYGQEGTAVCEVGTDGSGLRVVVAPADIVGAVALHHPDYAPDGSIVFEADPTGEQIWRLPAGSTTPVLLGAAFTNDNSPCVLPDGRVVSLWLNRPGSSGDHELKVMTSDGVGYEMLLTSVDVLDGGIGCGGFRDTIFADGFETGSTALWSTTSPTS